MGRLEGFTRFGVVTVALFWATALEAQIDGSDCITFRRADANSDSEVDVSDGVATLDFLFLGGALVSCLDAADANDSGDLDVADPIHTFEFLFLGGELPPHPGPFGCGPDETSDNLACADPGPCSPPEGILKDFSQFETFQFRYEPLCGLSEDTEGNVIAATIETLRDGQYSLEIKVLESGEQGVDECLPEYCDCFVAATLPVRNLTEPEVIEMQNRFAEVPVFLSSATVCACFPLDPPGFRHFSWDEENLSDDLCRDNHTDWSFSQSFQEFLMGLSTVE